MTLATRGHVNNKVTKSVRYFEIYNAFLFFVLRKVQREVQISTEELYSDVPLTSFRRAPLINLDDWEILEHHPS